MNRVEIYDTTLRDGSQGEGVNFSVQDKLLLTKRLDELGVDYIEGGYPLSNPKDSEYFRAVHDIPLKHAQVVAFGMTRRKGVAASADAGLAALLAGETAVVTIVGKTWDFHVREVLQVSLEENLAMIGDSVAHCVARSRRVFYDAEHFFDGLRANRDYALATLRAAASAGAETVALCDTNGGSLPEFVAASVAEVAAALPGVRLGIHCHNDCDLAVANSLAGVSAGAAQVQGTMNGIGERCGNADLVSVVANLALKYRRPVLTPESLVRLTEASRYVYELANMNFRSGQPFVGLSAFAHKGGMHTHAVAKSPASYEHIDPCTVGNERRILVSELSGQSTILAKTTKYALAHDKSVMAKILARVQDLEHAGYEFEAAEASFDILVKKVAGLYAPPFECERYRVNIEQTPAGVVTEATVKVRTGGRVLHTVHEGDGPVNALDAALREALRGSFPRLDEMALVDYKVRVVNSREATAARVRVVIESRDSTGVWGTVGVSENVVEASWLALVDSFEYKLFKDAEGDSHS